MRRWCTHAYEKDSPRVFVFVAFGIGIAFGIEVTGGLHFAIDADIDPYTVSDPGISRYHLRLRSRLLDRRAEFIHFPWVTIDPPLSERITYSRPRKGQIGESGMPWETEMNVSTSAVGPCQGRNETRYMTYYQ